MSPHLNPLSPHAVKGDRAGQRWYIRYWKLYTMGREESSQPFVGQNVYLWQSVKWFKDHQSSRHIKEAFNFKQKKLSTVCIFFISLWRFSHQQTFQRCLFLEIRTLVPWLKSTLLLKSKCFDTHIYVKTYSLLTNEMQH